MGLTEEKKQAMKHVQEVLAENGEAGWDKLYIDQVTPWNLDGPSPALVDLVEVKKFDLPDGRGLIAGCGQGYDALYLANEKRHVIGIDISETIINRAIQIQKEKAIDSSIATFVVGDFFKFSSPEKFQLVHDYAFLCALPLTSRKPWASKMAELISPGGVLIASMFPILPIGDSESGPPYAINLEMYQELLESDFTREYFDADCPTQEQRKGNEAMSVWRRK